MNNQALADVFGVPVDMVADAAVATGVSTQPAPAANPLAGIPVDNNYTMEEIDAVRNLVNSGQVDVNQVAQNFNVTPNYVAAALELPMDNMSIQAIEQ
jgi:hypothetical protein